MAKLIDSKLVDLLRDRFRLDWRRMHGSSHWARVHQNGLLVDAGAELTRVPEFNDRLPKQISPAFLRVGVSSRMALAEAFDGCDVLLTPSARGAAPAGLEKTGDPVFNRIWTLLGVPCVTIPVARAANGLPIGLQVVGLPMHDALTVARAQWMHESLLALS